VSRTFTRRLKKYNNESQYRNINSQPCHNNAPIPQPGDRVGQVRNAARNNRAAPNNRGAVHKVIIGSSSAPRQSTQQKQSSPFRPYSGLFATRFGPGTTEREVSSLIRNRTGYSLRPVKLRTKHDGYCSFYIECDKGRWDDLLTPDVWPTGILVKVYQ